MGEYISVVLYHQVVVICYNSPRKTKHSLFVAHNKGLLSDEND